MGAAVRQLEGGLVLHLQESGVGLGSGTRQPEGGPGDCHGGTLEDGTALGRDGVHPAWEFGEVQHLTRGQRGKGSLFGPHQILLRLHQLGVGGVHRRPLGCIRAIGTDLLPAQLRELESVHEVADLQLVQRFGVPRRRELAGRTRHRVVGLPHLDGRRPDRRRRQLVLCGHQRLLR